MRLFTLLLLPITAAFAVATESSDDNTDVDRFNGTHIPYEPGHHMYVHPDSYMAKRQLPKPGAYICSMPKWRGKCEWTPIENEKCYVWTAPSQKASFGVDQGLQCKLYYLDACSNRGGASTSGKLTFPGTDDLGNFVFAGERNFKSWRCRRCPNCINMNAPDWIEPTLTAEDGYKGSLGG